MTTYYLNEDYTYRPVETFEWAKQNLELCRTGRLTIAFDEINEYAVSTVWIGIDLSFSDGEPLVFETMIFNDHDNGTDIYQDRYSTYLDALEGHQKAIEWVKNHYE